MRLHSLMFEFTIKCRKEAKIREEGRTLVSLLFCFFPSNFFRHLFLYQMKELSPPSFLFYYFLN